MRFSLIRFRSPLLSESLLFSLPVGTEMFHFPTFPPNALCVQAPVTGHDSSWVSPFGHPRINARLPTPQGISQAPTSFIGSRCQGIHHVPLTTCPQQTTNTHKQTTTPERTTARSTPSDSLRNKPIKRTHKTINSIRNNTTPTKPLTKRKPTRVQCSRPLSRSQTTRSQPAPTLTCERGV